MNVSDETLKSYYTQLQKRLPDFRDNRGKRHDLSLIMLIFMYSILRSPGSLNYSLIHRTMKRELKYLLCKLGKKVCACISYSQLKRLLASVDYDELNQINYAFFGRTVKKDGRKWEAVDGKELRGTIDKAAGKKRSENIVQKVSHQSKESYTIGFYNGAKESEKTVVKNYFEGQQSLKGEAYSLDALHTEANFLETISTKVGIYLAQVKGNQKNLLEDCKHLHQNLKSTHSFSTVDKEHGRIEQRDGSLYHLNVESLDKKWVKTDIQTLVAVERNRTIVKTKKESNETAYFVTNLKLDEQTGKELFDAVRNHWSIESDNWVRDVNFGEDKIQCLKKNIPRVMGVVLGSVLNLLRRKNKNNLRALREELSQNRRLAYACWRGK